MKRTFFIYALLTFCAVLVGSLIHPAISSAAAIPPSVWRKETET